MESYKYGLLSYCGVDNEISTIVQKIDTHEKKKKVGTISSNEFVGNFVVRIYVGHLFELFKQEKIQETSPKCLSTTTDAKIGNGVCREKKHSPRSA